MSDTPSDDAGIKRALWWAVAALLLAVAATLFLLFTSGPGGGPSAQLGKALEQIPEARFTNVTAEAGIAFVHQNGAYGEKLLPETMGGGVAFFDFDNDGRQDLLFINSTEWPHRAQEGKMPPTLALYRNIGDGRFQDITAGSGLDAALYGMGAAVGDYDNDGFTDVFITAVGGNRLFRNRGGGRFSEVTNDAGVAGDPEIWSTSAAWVDYDNDGLLDLFVCNYLHWSREIDLEVDYKLPTIGRAYGPPVNYRGAFPSLYRNEGHGRFRDVSKEAGMHITTPATGLPAAKSLGVAPVDLDADGWIDLVVANDTVQNFVFHNERGAGFKEVGELSGAAFDEYGKARGAMGIDAARFGEDNRLAISIGNFANEMTAFYVSQRDALAFTDEAIARGIGGASRPFLTFGVFFFDYDLDGRLDLLTTNGHIEDRISVVQPLQQHRQMAQLFWNAGGPQGAAAFLPVPASRAGEDIFQPIVGRGSAFADIDEDGDLDVVMTQINGRPLLLRNDQKTGHRWIRLKLVGSKANRDAIGAWVKARMGNRIIWRQVMPARSYLSQSELPVTIGLGAADTVDELTIIWPGGEVQPVGGVEVGRLTTITQP